MSAVTLNKCAIYNVSSVFKVGYMPLFLVELPNKMPLPHH